MKYTITTILVMIAALGLLLTGCDKDSAKTNVTINPDLEINPITKQPPQDIVEKRGVTTNITEFNELLLRASRIQSYKYNLTDTAISDDTYRFYVMGRWVKVELPELMQHASGELFDEVIMDRLTKTALSHCSKNSCPKPNIDKELEKVVYDDYYIDDPFEYVSRFADAEFLKEELLGNDYTKVFTGRFEGNEARIWIQEYYGYPLMIMVKNSDGSKRTIKFDDMMVDATRSGEVEPPGNFTVKGEPGQWIFFKHYLGEWPEEGQKTQGGQPFSA
ncbi:hypothetical protein KY363_00585 [Candidatus Woesearchaeota archaeon]|nr:hypothetical protein [Candidatus Woesearchaeota archaeon]